LNYTIGGLLTAVHDEAYRSSRIDKNSCGKVRRPMLRLDMIASLLSLVTLMTGVFLPTDTIVGVDENPLILSGTVNGTIKTVDLNHPQLDVPNEFLVIVKNNKPVGKELVLVQFDNLSNAVYTYNSHIQLDDVGELTNTLTPIIRYRYFSST
jgi:hypothetical protein